MRKIAAGLLMLVVIAVAWWYASPLWTLHEMRDAAKARDAAKLSEYVDYPALRADVRGDLRRYILAEAAKNSPGGANNLAAAIALAVLGRIVDTAVSPAGVEAMLAEQEDRDVQSSRSAPVTAGKDPVIEREGLDGFKVHGKDASKGALVFHRHGLGWKLVGIDLPAPAGSG